MIPDLEVFRLETKAMIREITPNNTKLFVRESSCYFVDRFTN